MATDGTPNPSATYIEALYPDNTQVEVPHMVNGSTNPISFQTKTIKRSFGAPTDNGKFTSVEQNGEVVYSEGHPGRQPMT